MVSDFSFRALPRADYFIAMFYLVLGGALQFTGLGWAGSDLFGPAQPSELEQLWPAWLLLGCAGILLRTVRTGAMMAVTGCAVILSLLSGAGVVSLVLVFEVIFSGTLFGSARQRRIAQITGLGLSALTLIAALFGGSWQLVFVVLVQCLVVFLTPMWWAENVRQQGEIARTEQLRAKQAEQLLAQERLLAQLNLQLSVAAERGRMARDLHDVIAGRLSAIALQTAAALQSEDHRLHGEVLAAARQASVQALNDMRQMIEVLHTVDGASDGSDASSGSGTGNLSGPGLNLPADLQVLADSLGAGGTRVTLDLDQNQPSPTVAFSAAAGQAVYRICQEALANAIRHAPGAPVSVRLATIAEELVLTVTNSFPPEAPVRQPENRLPAGHGLRNMRVRAGELGGSLTAGARGGEGNGADSTVWIVEARLPQ
ncbi:sensor histidine kinase [Acaricomes phytoseiuli]|uniref:sensor histidine kinase n=1 Tax=Acaricomes phytoseiuli TaxID=291968 RepID=UPI0003650910|nr:histidine kinase [Acaricomes phytoseiuli]